MDLKKVPWHDTYNLESKEDEYGLGLQIWWNDRRVSIILGEHGEYGIAPIPELLIKLYQEGILVQLKEGE